MRRPDRIETASSRMQLKMTGMIDVVFLLLIFFVVTASFQPLEQLLPTNARLEGSSATPEPIELPEPDEPVIIEIRQTEDGLRWQVAGGAVWSLADLRIRLEALAAVDTGQTVILDIGPEVPLGDALEAYDLCRALGFTKIQFAADLDAIS